MISHKTYTCIIGESFKHLRYQSKSTESLEKKKHSFLEFERYKTFTTLGKKLAFLDNILGCKEQTSDECYFSVPVPVHNMNKHVFNLQMRYEKNLEYRKRIQAYQL